MVAIGNFFFKHRNWIFILLYAGVLVPSWPLFPASKFGPSYYLWPITIGLIITSIGQLIRGMTIGLAYIVRGGRQGRPYAEGLVTEGIFNHCRNPLYAGNILMLLGIGILANSLLYVSVFIPIFLFVYQAIVLAEEDFLRKKFGAGYDGYCRKVNRWVPNFDGIAGTFGSMRFNWKRWVLKEHTTQFIWLAGMVVILLFLYPELTHNSTRLRNLLLTGSLAFLGLLYLIVRLLKQSGRLKE
jgi:protein-S-isoprenylcysteine O-methyltransferase Ste14